jgi:DNA-directed RNA polymerase specialized sigma24 family protein
MSSVSVDPKKDLARDFLVRARDDLERAKRTRKAYVLAAREHGLTNQQIGDVLGISEARVRQLSRAE